MRHFSGAIAGLTTSVSMRVILVALALVAVALPALMPVVATPRTSPREIVLVAREMTFYLEGSKEPNPTIVVKPSEEIRLVVKNQDVGITHALSFNAVRTSIDRIVPGSTEKMTFRAPAKAGRYEYVCPPHAQMMKGVLLITQ